VERASLPHQFSQDSNYLLGSWVDSFWQLAQLLQDKKNLGLIKEIAKNPAESRFSSHGLARFFPF
jgi:hypothetical protein